jgi:alkylation response protein AidB-like acyl-CoA dehydrogenase
MTFELTDDQVLFRETVLRFAGGGDVVARRHARAQPGGVDPARWRELAALGVLALPAAAEAGGLGGSLFDCAVVAEALGYGAAPEPWLEAGFLPLSALAALGASDLAAEIASGTRHAALAFAEPRGRYRLDPVATRASGDRLSGAKTFVLAGGAAETLLVTAADEQGGGVYAVSADSVARRPYVVVDGGLAAELDLHDVPATRLGDVATIRPAIDATRLMASAELLGLAQRLFDETLAYVRGREQFGQPLGRFQVIQHRLVDCYAMLDLMRSTLWRALGNPDPARVAGAKAFIAERAVHIGHEAIQLHGGMGVTDELIVGHAHKRVMLLAKLFGDPAGDLATFAEAA